MRSTDASWIQRPLWATGAEGPLLLSLVRSAALAMLALVALLGLLLVARRASGALTEPLPPLALLAAGGLLGAAALLFRQLLVFPPTSLAASHQARPRAFKLSAMVSVVVALWALGLSGAGLGGGGLALWGLMLVEEGVSWELLRQSARTPIIDMPMLPLAGPAVPLIRTAAPAVLPGAVWSSATQTEAEADVELEACEAEAQRDEQLVQQHTRRRLDDGSEVLEGWLCVELAAGQRHATAHVAICPPLAGEPVCYAEQSDGPDAQVKVAQVMAHGARFEIKLDREQPEPSRVGIEFSIQQAAGNEEA